MTDEKIQELLTVEKTVQNPGARFGLDESLEQKTYELESVDGDKFLLYLRQNRYPGMTSDFSCGLALVQPNGEKMTLCRYNGPSHPHTNHLENESFKYVTHIHRARTDYLEQRNKADGFAEITDRFSTLSGALHCLVTDCNVKGIDTEPDQPTLFKV